MDAAGIIVRAGLVAGTLDIADALLFNLTRNIAPARVLRFIASGILGAKAARGGVPAALLGLLVHYVIAFTATIVFYAASRKFKFLLRRPVPVGLIYGALVYAVMNFIVLPLSAIPQPRPAGTAITLTNGVLAVVLLVGLPISSIVSRYTPHE